jgi:hypothetical protein
MPKIPGIGEVPNRTLLIGGGAAVVVVGVMWWRKRSAAAASTSSTDTASADQLDTGGGIVSGLGSGGTGTSSATIPTDSTPTSNDQWTALVLDRMGSIVPDQSALLAALGLYLTGQAVDAGQELLIDQAIAAAGYPPVHGANNYPPGIRQKPAAGQTPTGGIRRDPQPDNPNPIPFGYATGTWQQIVRAHYRIGGFTSAQIGTAASNLAHANGRADSVDPHKSRIQIILPQYLST